MWCLEPLKRSSLAVQKVGWTGRAAITCNPLFTLILQRACAFWSRWRLGCRLRWKGRQGAKDVSFLLGLPPTGISSYPFQKDPTSRQVTSHSFLYPPKGHLQLSTAHKWKPRPGIPEPPGPGSASDISPHILGLGDTKSCPTPPAQLTFMTPGLRSDCTYGLVCLPSQTLFLVSGSKWLSPLFCPLAQVPRVLNTFSPAPPPPCCSI